MAYYDEKIEELENEIRRHKATIGMLENEMMMRACRSEAVWTHKTRKGVTAVVHAVDIRLKEVRFEMSTGLTASAGYAEFLGMFEL